MKKKLKKFERKFIINFRKVLSNFSSNFENASGITKRSFKELRENFRKN